MLDAVRHELLDRETDEETSIGRQTATVEPGFGRLTRGPYGFHDVAHLQRQAIVHRSSAKALNVIVAIIARRTRRRAPSLDPLQPA
jgi:hypothetical protein